MSDVIWYGADRSSWWPAYQEWNRAEQDERLAARRDALAGPPLSGSTSSDEPAGDGQEERDAASAGDENVQHGKDPSSQVGMRRAPQRQP